MFFAGTLCPRAVCKLFVYLVEQTFKLFVYLVEQTFSWQMVMSVLVRRVLCYTLNLATTICVADAAAAVVVAVFCLIVVVV